MIKYDKYNNELTQYLSMLVDMDIKDYVGDIVGDIYSAEIPSNIPDATNIEDQEITCYTPYGEMNIEYRHEYNDELLIFRRIVGGAIYEEYRISMLDLLVVPRIKGAIYEPREDGIILTDIEREYGKSPVDESMRVISSRELKNIYTYDELEKHEIDSKSIVFKYPKHFSPTKLVTKVNFECVKRQLGLLTQLNIYHHNIESYAKKRELEPSFVVKMLLNSQYDAYQRLFYHRLEGAKLIERINSLIQGSIDSQTIKDIKPLMDLLANRSGESIERGSFGYIEEHPELLFDLLNSCNIDIWQNYQKGSWQDLANSYIGPSKAKMEHDYYEYIKSLVQNEFSINLPREDIAPLEIYNMLVKKHKLSNENI